MNKIAYLLTLFVCALICALHAAPAQAQRVFVSATGSDGNPCSFASPCRSFQHAHDVAPANGEIDVLDPAGYGSVTITKAISIQGHGFSGITVAKSGATGITITAGPNDIVTLRGLTVDGAGSGGYGIYLTAGGKLNVIDCSVTHFTYGILVEPTATTTTNTLVLVSNTIVTDTVVGIELATYGTGGIEANFGGLTLDNNGGSIEVFAQGGPIDLSVANSQIGHNNNSGIYSLGLANHENWVTISLTNVAFGLMPVDISLAGSTAVNMSHVTQQSSPRPPGSNYYPGGLGLACAGSFDFINSDGTNFLTNFDQTACPISEFKLF